MKNALAKYKIIIFGLICGMLVIIIELLFISNHEFSHEFHNILIFTMALGFIFTLSVVLQYYSRQQIISVQKLRESEHNLGERFKELTCLYGLSKLVENPEISQEAILQGTLDLILPAWQFPEITCARINFDDKEFKTSNFKETEWKLSTNINVHEKVMVIEVYYIEDKPFLKEEEHLIDDLGKRLKNITEHKQMEKKLEEQNKELEKLNELKSEFLRRASHELKTPLISIKGFSNLLLTLHREELSNDIISHLIEINQGCERLEDIIKNLIESSKLESSELKIETSREDLSFLIRFCLKELQSFIKSRNHRINVNIEDKIITRFNKEQIYEVISNLLSNSIKYTPPYGEINIQTELKDKEVIVKIQDNGIGFTENEKERVFQQFGKIERYGQGLDLEIGGSGLGLFISKKIVESYGGKIWLESEGRSRGSTFNFSLPLID